MYGLRESLSALAQEGLENVWRRPRQATQQLCTAMETFELTRNVEKPSNRLIGTATFKRLEGDKTRKLVEAMRAT